jgi:pyruvate,water dikinase
MRGASPVSAGAADELEPLVVGIRENKHSQALLESGESVDVLMALQSLSGRVGVATRSYLERVGYRLLYGWDVGQPYALEKPDVLVRAIRAAVEGARPTRPISELTQRVSEVRDRVPRDKRAGFDELLREARDVYRLREERTIFTVMWASGITRRTLLAAGEHLAARGRLRNPADVVEAAYPEIRSLLQGASRPSAAELSERAEYRRTARASDAPPTLGPAPQEPPPPDGLPAEALRVLRAMQTAVGALFGHSEAANEAQLIRGLAASPGVYEGVARVIADATELARLRRGDVLVAISTSESFNIALPLVGAIVTDWGGLLSHAAIVSRELGIPSVVGTREATASIPDGASVRVNGSAGEITILS